MKPNSIAKLAGAIFCASLLSLWSPFQSQAASPSLVAYWDFNNAADPTRTLDKVYGFEGGLENGAVFTADQGGHTGAAGDRAMDFGPDDALQVVRVSNATFLNVAAAQDQITISYWEKLVNVANASAFWGVAPSLGGDERGIQAHTPWGDSVIYFDTGGCCDGGLQRISKDASSIDFVTQWHHIALVKNKAVKQVWVDGTLFLQGTNTAPLPTDFSRLMIGAGQNGNISLQGKEDDFAVFAGALDQATIALLAGGTAPDNLPGVPVSTDPLIGGALASASGFSLKIQESSGNPIATNTLSLKLDGNAITPTSLTRAGQTTTIIYVLPGGDHFPPGSAHTVDVSVQDSHAVTVSATRSFVVSSYKILQPTWKVTPDTSKPGFLWNYFANSDSANTGNSNARTEADLSLRAVDATGASLPNLADPGAVGVALAAAAPANPANAPVQFEIPGVINLSIGGSADKNGNFTPDEQMPGVPSVDNTTTGQAAEIITYITLPVGDVVMGVNSDDGFSAASGPNPLDAFSRVELGSYDGGRGASDTLFVFVVQEAGTYPFRIIWENGGGGSNVELFTVNPDGTRVLVNNVAKGGFQAYRATTAAAVPYVKGVTPLPVPRQVEVSARNVTLVLADGANPVDINSVTLQIDGKAVTPTKTRQGNYVVVDSGVFDGLHLSGEANTGVLSFKDSTGAYSRTQQWTFYNLQSLVLPATPVAGENFDAYPEAPDAAHAAPPGWVLSNYSWLETGASGFGANGGVVWDLTAQANDPYLNWCMVSTDTGSALEAEILQNDTSQTINGIPVTDTRWMSNNCLFAASDSRARRVSIGGVNQPNDYAPQIQFAVSAPFNLSTVTNPVLTFSSGVRISGNGEEDALEYSVDGGTTWLPGMFMFNANRLFLNPDGTYDAMKIFTNVWTDVARFPVVQDPTTRDFISAGPLGQKFGDVLKVPITPALSPYIVNRNDTALSRKVEGIRLPEASKKSDVRLRFTHYGSCGWEWAVDNIAFYDVPPATGAAQPHIDSVASSSGQITIQWSNGGTLEWTASLVNPSWTTTGNSSGSFSEALSSGNKFYRVTR